MVGMNNAEFRYYAQWVTVGAGGKLRVEALRIRDADTDGFPESTEGQDNSDARP